MLTKTDLKAIKQIVQETAVTKDDVKSLATKDNLKNFATKNDLIGLAKGTEIDELKITFLDNLAKWKDELFTKIDKLVSNLKPTREEQTVMTGRQSEHTDTVEDHEKRISKLEQASPTT